jgi:hypothetical protein
MLVWYSNEDHQQCPIGDLMPGDRHFNVLLPTSQGQVAAAAAVADAPKR